MAFLESRVDSISVDIWITNIPAGNLDELCAALKSNTTSPWKIYHDLQSEAMVASLVKMYIRRLPSA